MQGNQGRRNSSNVGWMDEKVARSGQMYMCGIINGRWIALLISAYPDAKHKWSAMDNGPVQPKNQQGNYQEQPFQGDSQWNQQYQPQQGQQYQPQQGQYGYQQQDQNQHGSPYYHPYYQPQQGQQAQPKQAQPSQPSQGQQAQQAQGEVNYNDEIPF